MVLVTGGTGFLGAYIIKLLVEKGYAVRAIRRNNQLPNFIDAKIFENVEWVNGDVLDVVSLAEALKGVEQVIHSAAVVSFVKSERKKMYSVNIDGTTNMINLSLENNIKKFVHISSVAALGRTESGDSVNEEKKWIESKLNTHYAITKYKSELEVWRGIGEGLNSVILNPSTILGFGNWNSGSCLIFKNVYNNFPWYTEGVNGFVDVEDVAKAAVALLESDISEQRFIINGDNWPFRNLFNTIATHFGKKHPSKKATKLLSGIAWRIEAMKSFFSGQASLLTKESAKIAQSKTYFENEKLLAALPEFSFTPIEKTIQKACVQYSTSIQSNLIS